VEPGKSFAGGEDGHGFRRNLVVPGLPGWPGQRGVAHHQPAVRERAHHHRAVRPEIEALDQRLQGLQRQRRRDDAAEGAPRQKIGAGEGDHPLAGHPPQQGPRHDQPAAGRAALRMVPVPGEEVTIAITDGLVGQHAGAPAHHSRGIGGADRLQHWQVALQFAQVTVDMRMLQTAVGGKLVRDTEQGQVDQARFGEQPLFELFGIVADMDLDALLQLGTADRQHVHP